MREARLIVPTVKGKALELLLLEIVRVFGGATVYQGSGLWRQSVGTILNEPINIIDIAYEPSSKTDARLYDMAWYILQTANQQEVYLRYGNGHVQMVTEKGCMDNGADEPWSWDAFREELHRDQDDMTDIPEEHVPAEVPTKEVMPI